MYSVTVKIEDIERRRRSAGLMHLLLGFFLLTRGIDQYRYQDFENVLPALPTFFMALVSLAYGFFRKQFDPLAQYNGLVRLAELTTLLLLLFIFLRQGRGSDQLSLYAFTAVALLLLITEQKIFQPTDLLIGPEGISLPGTYKRQWIHWQAIEDVVMREDFVTIFPKAKKQLQFQVMQDLSTLEVAKMNAFCKEQLARATSGETEEVNGQT